MKPRFHSISQVPTLLAKIVNQLTRNPKSVLGVAVRVRVVVSGVSLMRELYSQLTRYAARRRRRVESCQVAVHAPRFHHRVGKNHHQVLTLQMHGQKAVKQRSRLAHATRIEDAVWLQAAEVGCRKQ